MRLVPFGRTGLFVSELCLGTMTFGGSEGMWGKIGTLQQQDAERLVGQALDRLVVLGDVVWVEVVVVKLVFGVVGVVVGAAYRGDGSVEV